MDTLLQKPVWSNKDIQEFTGCSATTAVKIRREAILKYDGLIPILPRKTKRDAILKVLNLEVKNVWQQDNGGFTHSW